MNAKEARTISDGVNKVAKFVEKTVAEVERQAKCGFTKYTVFCNFDSISVREFFRELGYRVEERDGNTPNDFVLYW